MVSSFKDTKKVKQDTFYIIKQDSIQIFEGILIFKAMNKTKTYRSAMLMLFVFFLKDVCMGLTFDPVLTSLTLSYFFVTLFQLCLHYAPHKGVKGGILVSPCPAVYMSGFCLDDIF